MKRALRTFPLLVCLAMVIHAGATTLPDACGDDKVTFDVKTEKGQPVPPAPDAGKAQVIVIENFEQNQGFCIGCKVTTRVGMDGAWVGANHGNSYFALAVEPGEHHLCVDWQSALGTLKKKVGLASLTAQAGQVYYYQIKVREMHYDSGTEMNLSLTPLNEDEGKYLVKVDPLSTFTAKK